MKKSTLVEIINEALEMNSTDNNFNVVKDIKTKKVEELGKTVIYIKAKEENMHCFGKSHWVRTPFESEYIFIEDTHELLTKDWEVIA